MEVSTVLNSLNHLENEFRVVQEENIELKQKLALADTKVENLQKESLKNHKDLVDMHCRSIRYNLIFQNISEGNGAEDTEEVLNSFLRNKMKIPTDIQLTFDRVHRMGKKDSSRKKT